MTTYMASSGIPVQALGQFGALAGVAFVNPNAAQARSNRRKKLSASRARQAASSKIGGAALSSTSSADGTVIDEKETRKQQRMLRNRESAAMSRKRKSDRVGELEEQIDLLRKENHCLRNRIFQLEAGTTGENLGVKPTDMRSPSVRNLSDVTVSSCGPLLSPMPTALPFAPINQSYTPGVASDPVITPFCSTNAGGGVISAATASFNNIVSRPAVFA